MNLKIMKIKLEDNNSPITNIYGTVMDKEGYLEKNEFKIKLDISLFRDFVN